MRKPLLVIVFVTFSCGVFAQGNKEELEILQSVFSMEKKSVAAELLSQKALPNMLFGRPTMNMKANARTGKKRVALLEKYTSSYAILDDKSTGEIINEMTALQGETDKLIVTY